MISVQTIDRVILFIMIGEEHQFCVHCLIPLGPCLVQNSLAEKINKFKCKITQPRMLKYPRNLYILKLNWFIV